MKNEHNYTLSDDELNKVVGGTIGKRGGYGGNIAIAYFLQLVASIFKIKVKGTAE